ncbi:MAG: glycosyltransferase family 4 protein [archaeon]|nr:glycosyltransferase family 4 protein [archaeon]
MNENKAVVHILMTDYTMDSRLRNETVSLSMDNYDVKVYCLRSGKQNNSEIRKGVSIKRFGIVGSRILTYLSAYLFMFFYSLNKRIDCIHAHDANALPIAYLIAKTKGIPFIYDSHELWVEAHHSLSSEMILSAVAFMEKIFARRAKQIITVSDSIKKYLKNHFDVDNINVIRNIPCYTHSGHYDLFREKYHLSRNVKIFLYQGLISKTRCVDLIVKAAISVCNRDARCVFFFLGDGPYMEELNKTVKDSGMQERIKAIGTINQDELLKYTMSADIGIHAINNSCLNHDYCLPNKVFEYIHSGLVLVATGLTELKKFIIENNIGLTFKDSDQNSLEAAMITLLNDEVLFEELKINTIKASDKYLWSNEYLILKDIYKKVL